MEVNLNPEILKFIEEQIESGDYPTPEAVIEAAILDMRDYAVELTEEDIAAIKVADEQAERGEVIDIEEVRAYFAKKDPEVR